METGPSLSTTASMLGDISSGTAADLVMAVRYTNAAPGPTFVVALDEALQSARGKDASTLRRGDMVEIIGPTGSGKTAFVLFLVLTRILPASYTLTTLPLGSKPTTVPLGGRNENVTLIIPSSHQSPIPRLAESLREHIHYHTLETLSYQHRSRPLPEEITDQIEKTVRNCLSRANIIRTKPRWASLYLALQSILHPPALTLNPGEEMNERVDIVIIDGFADGFWPERWNAEGRAIDRKHEGRIRGAEDIGVREVMASIESLRKELGSIVCLTLQGLWPSGGLYNPHLPAPYPAPFGRDKDDPPRAWSLNIQITLTGRTASHQYPADITLVDALRSLDMNRHNQDVLEGVVRVPGGEGLAGTESGIKFAFRIGLTGIEVRG